jgi:riboflavin kinase/FMN adenylyltransferase
VVGAAAEIAHERGIECIAVTFTPRPDVVWGRSTLPDICPIEERIIRLRRAGADRVVVLPFSKTFAGIGYEAFTGMLTDCLQMRVLYVGSDFALGAGRTGTPLTIGDLGVEVQTHALVMAADGVEKVSSSTIRRLIASSRRDRGAL